MLAASLALQAVWPELRPSFGAHGGPEGRAPGAHSAGEGTGSTATQGLPLAPSPSLPVRCVRGSAFSHSEAAEGTCVGQSFSALSLCLLRLSARRPRGLLPGLLSNSDLVVGTLPLGSGPEPGIWGSRALKSPPPEIFQVPVQRCLSREEEWLS